MNRAILTAAFATLATTLSAQVTEIPAMTVSVSSVDFNTMPAGTTNLTAINNAGNNGGAPLAAISLLPSTAQSGIYNTNPQLGRALARVGSTIAIVPPIVDGVTDPPTASPNFDAFDAQFDLSVRGTEFGIAVGDWLGSIRIEFHDRTLTTTTLVGSITTSNYTAPAAKFFRSQSTFDRVIVRASTADGNFVIPQLHLQTAPAWEPLGFGCAGAAGVPSLALVAPPRIGNTFRLGLSGMPPSGGFFITTIGSSTTTSAAGPLPASLDGLGAPGCILFVEILGYSIQSHTNGTGQFSYAIPNNPAAIGIPVANQAFVTDPTANAAGLITSNAGAGVVR